MKRKWIIIAAAIAVAVVAVVLIVCLCGRNKSHALPAEEAAEEETVELLFGIDKQRYDIEQGIVREGETAGQILARYGVGAGTVDRIAKAAEPASRTSGSASLSPYSARKTRRPGSPISSTSRRRPTT